ncbi:Gluconate 5-dehydrogenase [Zhongshania aliphaticivorans]|uniref:Gluconate 5-dehydrogenase n=1 Tax=Zhongshania aliphaticivorans TaxID=1470434 RepID=A0A5S9Q2P8_9GAMM|nr:SDR family oxidoreductase [Zhongshania aliphaticivorans]CAA0111208.1 Gluconate 5-dehydrogenase [Zhongshania aliphaticivorans]CAA0118508.1 Gluconate 5-dehydrogenase [Zhongshania aliphaticivorans]
MNNGMFSVDGKIVLVTGASSGIGYALSKGLAEHGAYVIAAARRVDKLKSLCDEVESNGGKIFTIKMDVSDRASVVTGFDHVNKHVGVIDTVVNNAGIAAPSSFVKIDEKTRDAVMGTNFNGVWNVAQEAAQRLIKSERPGSIINIASVLALGVKPGQSVYCASKGAVAQLTRGMALDLIKYGIRSNAIAPGWFKTEMSDDFFESDEGLAYISQMPAKRLGTLDELIGPVIMLASDAASFVNGVVIPVDGALNVVTI